jgi:hypothetical protein
LAVEPKQGHDGQKHKVVHVEEELKALGPDFCNGGDGDENEQTQHGVTSRRQTRRTTGGVRTAPEVISEVDTTILICSNGSFGICAAKGTHGDVAVLQPLDTLLCGGDPPRHT